MKRKNIPSVILIIFIFVANIFSQNLLPPPAENLTAIHYPDLKDVEKSVREQISAFQTALAETVGVRPLDAKNLSEAYGTMGQVYHAYTFFESAEECYQNAARLAPKDFRWTYLLGKAYADDKHFNDAIYYFGKAKELQPNYLPLYVNLGDAYLEMNLISAARDSFEQALKIDADAPAALYGLGKINYAEKNYEKSAANFERVLALVPNANRVEYSLALVYRDMKNAEKAKMHMARQGAVGVRVNDPLYDSLSEFRKGVRLYLIRGKQALEAGRPADAQIEFQKALAAEPDNVTALVNYGAALLQVKKIGEAATYFQKAIKLSPENISARFNLAVILSITENHFEAIKQLKAILQIDAQDVDARLLLAKELRDADLLQESMKEFISVYNANPDSEEILIELVKLLYKRREYKQAKELLEKSYEKFPARTQTAATLAFLLASSPAKDLRDGKKALELSKTVYDKTKIIEHGAVVAMAYAELGQCDEAVKFANGLLQLATGAGNENLVRKLKNEIKQYEAKPCQT